MKINKVTTASLSAIATENKSKVPTKKLSPSVPHNDVRVGDTATIATAAKTLSEIPDIDMEKVKQVQQAIAKGELKIDLTSLAQSIMNEHLLDKTNND
ncbi:flagellar biosynthesis anti-sigma factor FlgM [Psychromonas sp.]|uniref:flagellar biosynthesis anti-sigma factor FlgM n=1 Tax=Psychromonas sp. TaxID=1884585 RepID=UPI0039E64F9F